VVRGLIGESIGSSLSLVTVWSANETDGVGVISDSLFELEEGLDADDEAKVDVEFSDLRALEFRVVGSVAVLMDGSSLTGFRIDFLELLLRLLRVLDELDVCEFSISGCLSNGIASVVLD